MGLHDGHRARKKALFRQSGLDGFADHEVLELVLYYAIPRRDTNETAHRLIQRQIPALAALAMPVVQAHDDPSPPAVKTVNSRQYSIPHISMCHKLFFRTFVAVQDRLTLWRRRGIVPVLSAATG